MQNKRQIPDNVEGIIYKMTCSSTNKSYVGQTLSHRWNHGKWRPYGVERRLRSHITSARSGVNTTIYNAMREHGEDTFSIQELFRCAVTERDENEKAAMVSEKTVHPDGYNMYLAGSSAQTGVKRITIKNSKKADVRKRAYDLAFKSSDDVDDVEVVLKAHIREQAGVSPKFSVFLETASHKTTRTMRRTTFSATASRGSVLQQAREFALQYTQNIDFVPRTEGKSRSQANQEKIISVLGDTVLKIRVHSNKDHIALYFETADTKYIKQMMRTSFLDSMHDNDKTKTLHAAREWAKTNFKDAKFVKCGTAAKAIDDADEE